MDIGIVIFVVCISFLAGACISRMGNGSRVGYNPRPKDKQPKPKPTPHPKDIVSNSNDPITDSVKKKKHAKWKVELNTRSNCEIMNVKVFHIKSNKAVSMMTWKMSFDELLVYIDGYPNEKVYIHLPYVINRQELSEGVFNFGVWNHSMVKVIKSSSYYNPKMECIQYSPEHVVVSNAYDKVLFDNMSEVVSVLPPPPPPEPSPFIQKIDSGECSEIYVDGKLTTTYKKRNDSE